MAHQQQLDYHHQLETMTFMKSPKTRLASCRNLFRFPKLEESSPKVAEKVKVGRRVTKQSFRDAIPNLGWLTATTV